MKKVKLSTALLALIVGTYVAPVASVAQNLPEKNSEETVASTEETKEEVEEAPVAEEPAAETPAEEAPVEKEPVAETPAPNKEEEEAPAPTKEEAEAPVQKTEEKTRDAAADLEAAKEAAIDELFFLLSTGDLELLDYQEAELAIAEATTVAQVNAIVAKAKEETPEVDEALEAAKEAASDELFFLLTTGDLDLLDYYEAMEAVEAATTVAAVEEIVANAKKETPEVDEALEAAKEAAKDELFFLLTTGDLELLDYYEAMEAVEAATTVAEVEEIVANAKKETPEVDEALEAAKEAAKDELFFLLTTGDLDLLDYYEAMEAIEAATTVAEVEEIVANAKKETPEVDEALEAAKEAARDELFFLLTTGDLDLLDYYEAMEAIEAATTVEEVQAILDGLNKETPEVDEALEAAKKAAKDELFFLLTTGDLDLLDYYEAEMAVEAATTVEEVQEILDRLSKHEKLSVDVLVEAIEKALTLEEANYTPESWVTFAVELAKAEELLAVTENRMENDVTQADIDAQAAALNAAIDALEEKVNVLNVDALVAAIEAASILEEANYTPESWAVFAVALDDAEEFLASTENRIVNDITQADVDAQAAALNAAIAALVGIKAPGRALDVTELAETINSAKLLEEAKYTKATWGIFAAALVDAENFLASLEVNPLSRAASVEVTQADIDAQTQALKDAIAQLALAKEDGTEDKIDDKEEDKIDDKKEDKKEDKKADSKKEGNLPQTGEKENALATIYGLITAGLAGAFVFFRRSK